MSEPARILRFPTPSNGVDGERAARFWQGRKVAVTGATGFLGHQAALELRRQGADVFALARESSDVSRLLAAQIAVQRASLADVANLKQRLTGCDVVLHLAGFVSFANVWEPFIHANVEGTRNVLEAARRAGVRRLVHTSSIVAVGASKTALTLDESAQWNLGPCRIPYVTSKRQAEEAALEANGRDLEVVVVNPGSVVGPDDFTGSEFGTLCRRFWKKRIPFHFGGGNNFVDVRDVACGIRLAAERGRAGQRYLLTGENRSYAEFFHDLSEAAKRRILHFRLPNKLASLIGFLNDRFNSDQSKRPYMSSAQAALMGLYFHFSADKARRELGFEARPLKQTLADAHAFWMAPRLAA